MDDQAIRNAIVTTMPNKRVVGGHKKQATTVVRLALPSQAEGRGKELIDDLVQADVVERSAAAIDRTFASRASNGPSSIWRQTTATFRSDFDKGEGDSSVD